MNTPQVLIVGAGPTGLMMACLLARQGIAFRIIDKKSEHTSASNATWIQTRTIELLDQLGIADRFIKVGHACDGINLYADGKHVSKLSLKNLNSIFPFILMMPQSKTEKLLEEYLNELNHQVERSLELIDVKSDKESAVSSIKHADGRMEIIKTDWLIACDGANSVIREKCGFHFPGKDLTEQFVVADAKIDFSYMPKDEIHFFFDPGTVLAAFPLGSDKYRLAANLHLDSPRKIFTEREIIEIVQERAHGSYYVTNVEWISMFWIHSKLVKAMRKNTIFLVGDAAHIQSPAGGQGMNTGMQDAYNLAWKLALVIEGKAKPSLLNSYQTERYPVVKEIVEENEHFTKMALFDKNFLPKLHTFSQQLAKKENVKYAAKVGNKLTQLDIQYKDSTIIEYGRLTMPKPGERAPDVFVDHTSLYHFLSSALYTVFLFTGASANEKKIEKLRNLQKHLEEDYSHLLKTYIVSTKELTNSINVIEDVNGNIHEAYKIKKPAICIIRPDTYIAYYSQDLNLESIVNFFRHIYMHDFALGS